MIVDGLILATVLCGLLGVILKRNLVMKILAMDVMGTGVIAWFVVAAGRSGVRTPIATAPDAAGGYADPVPQAVILTAIVIGLSLQALMLVGVIKLSRDHPTLEVDAIEESLG